MRKSALICAAGLAAMMVASNAKAVPVVTSNNGLAVWLDIRDNTTAGQLITPGSPSAPWTVGTSNFTFKKTTTFTRSVTEGNDGGPGDGQILYISPRLPTVAPDTEGKHITYNAKKTIRVNQSVKSLHEYITVGDRAAPAEVIGALGRNLNAVKAGLAANGNKVQALSVAQNTALWSAAGTTSTVSDNGGTQTDWTLGLKAVKVPVTGPTPTFNAAGGAIPVGVYRTSTITVTAGEWNKTPAVANASPLDSTYCVKLAVNNLLITRVYDGAGPTPEQVDFGYLIVATGATTDVSGSGSTGLNLPEAAGSGSTVGTTSTQCDAEIRVQMKGDHNNDGLVNSTDQADQNTAYGAGPSIRVRELYLADFDNNNIANSADQSGFNAYLGISGLGCPPCP